MQTQQQPTIVKREIRFSHHIPANYRRDGSEPTDIHYVKEQITYSDGTKKPNTYLLKNFERPVWIVKPQYRGYNEPREFFDIDKLTEHKCTQSNINRLVASAIGLPHLASQPRELKSNPYIFGYDIASTVYLKMLNLLKNKSVQSAYSISAFDIETDLETEEVILATIAMNGKAYTGILARFVATSVDVQNRVRTALELYLPQYKDMDYKVEIFDNEVKLIHHVFQVAVKWAPDFMAIWNMDFDIPRILSELEKHKIDPKAILCDPKVPPQYRECYYKQGIKKKVTSSGVVKPIPPSAQWHTLHLTTPFYVIDAMCTYRQLRVAEQEKPSYSLDSILKEELNVTKLKFTQADKYSGKAWHEFMQKYYPIEYVIYNLYDCLSMLELDKKTKDLAYSLPAFAGASDFARFTSNPKKITDALFPFALNRGRVIGTVGKIEDRVQSEEIDDSVDIVNDEEEDDSDGNIPLDVKNYRTLNLKGWILTLPQHQLVHDGLHIIEENPGIVSNIRGLVYDLDVSSSYPSCTLVANVSKETTENELVSIVGISEKMFREQNLGLIVGPVNAIEYCNKMLALPTLDQINSMID